MQVYRHGFRAPIYNPYPADPYQDLNKYFPEGKGGLTKVFTIYTDL